MASIEELYKKSEISKKVANKVDKTPISDGDFDLKKISKTEEQLAKARGGKLSDKKYSDSVQR